jgi:hypothetical protein
MPPLIDPVNITFFLPSLLLLLHNVVGTMLRPVDVVSLDKDSVDVDVFHVEEALLSMNTIVASVLYDFRLAHAFELIEQELG